MKVLPTVIEEETSRQIDFFCHLLLKTQSKLLQSPEFASFDREDLRQITNCEIFLKQFKDFQCGQIGTNGSVLETLLLATKGSVTIYNRQRKEILTWALDLIKAESKSIMQEALKGMESLQTVALEALERKEILIAKEYQAAIDKGIKRAVIILRKGLDDDIQKVGLSDSFSQKKVTVADILKLAAKLKRTKKRKIYDPEWIKHFEEVHEKNLKDKITPAMKREYDKFYNANVLINNTWRKCHNQTRLHSFILMALEYRRKPQFVDFERAFNGLLDFKDYDNMDSCYKKFKPTVDKYRRELKNKHTGSM